MGRYTDWANVTARYPVMGRMDGSANMNSSYIAPAENMVDGLLSNYYTVPFSSNNVTAKDLVSDLVYIRAGNLKIEERNDLQKQFFLRIDRLKMGEENMMLDTGVVMNTIGGTVFSSTSGYHPVFGMSPEKYLQVDSSQVYNEENDRGNV